MWSKWGRVGANLPEWAKNLLKSMPSEGMYDRPAFMAHTLPALLRACSERGTTFPNFEGCEVYDFLFKTVDGVTEEKTLYWADKEDMRRLGGSGFEPLFDMYAEGTRVLIAEEYWWSAATDEMLKHDRSIVNAQDGPPGTVMPYVKEPRLHVPSTATSPSPAPSSSARPPSPPPVDLEAMD